MEAVNSEILKKKLVSTGLKATLQRIVILRALFNINHPTAEIIYESLKAEFSSISLGTVYKTLDTFVSHGLACRVLTNEGPSRYDFNTVEHSHIYCYNTKEIIDFEDPELDLLLKEFFKSKNFSNLKIKDIKIQVTGEKIDPDKKIQLIN